MTINSCSCSRGGNAQFCECRQSLSEPALEIARANANAAIDQADAYKDSIASYAQNVRDTLDEKGLSEHEDSALAAYYSRVGALLWMQQNSVPAPAPTPEESGADSAAAAVNSGGATSEQVLENGRWKVTIRADRMSGWFERDGEAIGGLIFDKIAPLSDPSKIELTDYDGVFALPNTVAKLLRDADVHVDSTFLVTE